MSESIKKQVLFVFKMVVGTLIVGFALGRAVVTILDICTPKKYTGLHNAVQIAQWTIDRELGNDTFLYGVRGIYKDANHEVYMFRLDINKGTRVEKRIVSVDLTKNIPEIKPYVNQDLDSLKK